MKTIGKIVGGIAAFIVFGTVMIVSTIFWLPSAINKRSDYKKAVENNNLHQKKKHADKAKILSPVPFIPYLLAFTAGMTMHYIFGIKEPVLPENAKGKYDLQFILLWCWVMHRAETNQPIDINDQNSFFQ